MTINVALCTSGALVLGCDSVASIARPLLDPWSYIRRGADGSPLYDEDGRLQATFEINDVQSVVTQVFGGVTKIFPLCNTAGTHVAATTAGLAALGGRSMEDLAGEFRSEVDKLNGAGCDTVQGVAERFATFLRGHYDAHYGADPIPDSFKDDIEFLVGGYGGADHFASIWRINMLPNTVVEVYKSGAFGCAWAGQSDGVGRLVFGCDSRLKRQLLHTVQQRIDGLYEAYSQATAKIVENILKALGAAMPEGIDTSLPDKPNFDFPWAEHQLDIECQNLPLQDAIDLVTYLVYVQAGRMKFVRGVPTVGGRIRVGYMTRATGFRLLNEPEIVHRITGFPVHV